MYSACPPGAAAGDEGACAGLAAAGPWSRGGSGAGRGRALAVTPAELRMSPSSTSSGRDDLDRLDRWRSGRRIASAWSRGVRPEAGPGQAKAPTQ